MGSACDDHASCIRERRKHMAYQPGDPRNWTASPCLNCRTGRDRQMSTWQAEPDPVDDPTKLKRPFRIEPSPCVICGTIVNKPSYRTRPICKSCYWDEKRAKAAADRAKHKCAECGANRTKYAKLCNACYKRSRHPITTCMQAGCTSKPRRKGLCEKHFYATRSPEEKKRKNEANAAAAKKYREVNHRIAQMNMAKPKTPVREVPE